MPQKSTRKNPSHRLKEKRKFLDLLLCYSWCFVYHVSHFYNSESSISHVFHLRIKSRSIIDTTWFSQMFRSIKNSATSFIFDQEYQIWKHYSFWHRFRLVHDSRFSRQLQFRNHFEFQTRKCFLNFNILCSFIKFLDSFFKFENFNKLEPYVFFRSFDTSLSKSLNLSYSFFDFVDLCLLMNKFHTYHFFASIFFKVSHQDFESQDL